VSTVTTETQTALIYQFPPRLAHRPKGGCLSRHEIVAAAVCLLETSDGAGALSFAAIGSMLGATVAAIKAHFPTHESIKAAAIAQCVRMAMAYRDGCGC
jgi:hypothetical protein